MSSCVASEKVPVGSKKRFKFFKFALVAGVEFPFKVTVHPRPLLSEEFEVSIQFAPTAGSYPVKVSILLASGIPDPIFVDFLLGGHDAVVHVFFFFVQIREPLIGMAHFAGDITIDFGDLVFIQLCGEGELVIN